MYVTRSKAAGLRQVRHPRKRNQRSGMVLGEHIGQSARTLLREFICFNAWSQTSDIRQVLNALSKAGAAGDSPRLEISSPFHVLLLEWNQKGLPVVVIAAHHLGNALVSCMPIYGERHDLTPFQTSLCRDPSGSNGAEGSDSGSRRLPPLSRGTVALVALGLANSLMAAAAERRNPPVGKFVEVDGVPLALYLDQGKGEPLVLLHGNGSMI